MKDTTKLNLRMPATDRTEAAALAEGMGLSLNAYILLAVRNANVYRAQQAVKFQRAAVSRQRQAAASRDVPKVAANQPCPCGSGKKYKRCHGGPAMA